MHCKYAFEPTIYHRYNNVCSKCCRDDDGFPHCQVNTAPVGHGIPLGCLSRSPGPEGTTQRGPYRTAQPPYHAICHIKGGTNEKDVNVIERLIDLLDCIIKDLRHNLSTIFHLITPGLKNVTFTT